jgi:glyoxylase-like metal-dependent hydrolase (beta-lactamase superfamily II)
MGSIDLWDGAEWFDDWFATEAIDDRTVAIAEPRYWQFPVSYLIHGEARALLFDSGSGRRDIRPVVDAFADLPVTVAFSHPHFDHVGGHLRFHRVAMFDHPTLRRRIAGDRFTPSLRQHLKLGRPSFLVAEWWAAGQLVDLGARQLEVLHVPGHSPDSIALLDRARGQLFLGDFLYNYELYVEDPEQYLESTQLLLELTDGTEVLYGAHGVPMMPYGRLEELNCLLGALLRGDVKGKPSLQGLVPQRRLAAGEVELRLLWLGTAGLLLPYLVGVLVVLLLAITAGVLLSWVAAIPILVVGSLLVALAYRRL